jgi:hypothetical protein
MAQPTYDYQRLNHLLVGLARRASAHDRGHPETPRGPLLYVLHQLLERAQRDQPAVDGAPRAQPTDEPTDNPCIVCCVNRRTMTARCGHRCACFGCSARLAAASDPRCPVCRAPWTELLRVYE